MMEAINLWIANAADWVFGWILFLPRDLSLFCVAVLTSASLSFVRKWTTDQEWLHRAMADEERQNQLQREAKARGDKDAVKRHTDVVTLIKMKSMRFEGKPLLWALLPVALLATWAFSRLAYVPTRVNETVEVRAYLPRSSIGQTAHLAPEPGLAVVDGWIQPVVEDKIAVSSNAWDVAGVWIGDRFRGFAHGKPPMAATPPPLTGVVTWRVIAHDRQPHTLKIRYAGRTFETQFLAGKRQYVEPIKIFDDAPVQSIEVALKPMRLFDFVGGIDWLFLPPWLVAYLLICIPFVTILRKAFRIA